MRRQPGRPRGTRHCDFKTLLRFLMFFRREPRTIYALYHSTSRWDIRKIYRYLRYSADLGLLEINHIEEMPGPLPAKWWRLTERGRELLDWCLRCRLIEPHGLENS